MADKSLKVSENVSGKWYVDENCIACDSCISIAPDIFVMNDDSTHAYVKKQPSTAEEIQLAEDAKGSCPTEAIGDDGE
ncbi:MAG: ferredoxin [Acidobacteria bacterium]|nr:ferredoxin [Acidobacteriota bacterium]